MKTIIVTVITAALVLAAPLAAEAKPKPHQPAKHGLDIVLPLPYCPPAPRK